MAMPSFNILSCFSEQREKRRYVCEGDVCYLRDTEATRPANSKKIDTKSSSRVPFYRVSSTTKSGDHVKNK
ncbi:hypothetical protein CASFOL_025704 [Castilleja foliolosa]|uniref:Uncharacterized protein n=1 Tax=Castilleja foliolosa TaxID=1961234 RepID=A0ABD3CRX4_9LAMI